MTTACDAMLSDEEKKEIEAELANYEVRQAGCIDALKIVQRYKGWVSDESVREIAAFLGMYPDEVDSVASFYNLIYRRPVGRNVIHVCDSITCWIMGYESIRQYLEKQLDIRMGETTKDGRFTLLPIPCLGTCDHAPAMMVGDDLHQGLSPDKIDTILEKYQ